MGSVEQVHRFRPNKRRRLEHESTRKMKIETKKKKVNHYCCISNCDGNDNNATLRRVPDPPPKLPAGASVARQQTFHTKMFMSQERMDLMGRGRSCSAKNLRACDKHWVTVTGKHVSVHICQPDGSTVKKRIAIPPFKAPKRVGDNSFHAPPVSLSKGNAYDRGLFQQVCRQSMDEPLALPLIQYTAMEDVRCGKLKLADINPSVLVKAGLDVHIGTNDDMKNDDDEYDDDVDETNREPVLTLDNLTDDEVQRRTGFRDLELMLAFALVVCRGDIEKLTCTNSRLTWIEEWVLYFEFVSHKSMVRWKDYAVGYKCRVKTIRDIVRRKLTLVVNERQSWPMYTSQEEDVKFRNPKWNFHFDPKDGPRVVMHDSTNFPMQRPTDAALQRALWNAYYSMCCAKAGVATQLCGWIYGLPLQTGHSDDTRFIADSGILRMQREFAENDSSSNKPCLNIFDKGYQCVLQALMEGQECLQPTFAESDTQFTDRATLYSAAVAVVRSGNERAVNRCKMSRFIRHGNVDGLYDIDFCCDIWEAFTFQVNFMYDKYL
jgi:hypothetical protein